MKCEKCGKDIPKGFSFCLACQGQPKINEAQQQQVTDPINYNVEEKEEQKTETVNVVVKCKCGQILETGCKFCSKCNEPITVEISNNSNQQSNNEELAKNYILITIICYALSYLTAVVFPIGFYVLQTISTISIIMGKIKYPNNKAMKVLLYLIIFNFIGGVICLICILIMCTRC